MKLIEDKFYAIYLVLNKEMAQKSEATKFSLKNLKTYYDWMN